MVYISNGVGSNNYTTYLGVLDSGAIQKIVSARSTTKDMENQATKFQEKWRSGSKQSSLPQFIAKRKVDTKCHLFSKSDKKYFQF